MVVMSESARGDEPRTWWKEIIKRRIVNLYSAALVGGQRHVEYLVELGVPRERIFTGYDVVDNDWFAQRAIEIRNSHLRRGYGGQAAFEIRKKYGLPENYFLASARFVEKKNLTRLIRAYAEYRDRLKGTGVTDPSYNRGAPWDLVLLGDGPLRETLNTQLSTLNLHSHVHLPGFKQYDELPVYYGLANAFVHASTSEQWGLVVNEAMASGLPVLVSEQCGCAPDLVKDNVNGFGFDPFRYEQPARLMFQLANMPSERRAKMGSASREIISEWGPERFADGLVSAAQEAIAGGPRPAKLLQRVLLPMLMR